MLSKIIIKFFSFLVSNTSKEPTLMDRANHIVLSEPPISSRTIKSNLLVDEPDYNRDFDDFQDELNTHHLHDPYINPGQDIVVDEIYHGIDHSGHDY